MAFKKIVDAITNEDSENPNLFATLHGSCLDVTDPLNVHRNKKSDFFTRVPKDLVVFVFTPTNHCAFTNEDVECEMKEYIEQGMWMFSPERNEGGLFEHTQIYLPGNKIHNINFDGDDQEEHFGVFTANPHEESWKTDMVVDTSNTETTYDTERLLLTFSVPGVTRAIYILSCSPHTIQPTLGSTIKWKGKAMPVRKATKKYDSFTITSEIHKKVVDIEAGRFECEVAGKKRFWDFINSCPFEPRFTRSMTPVKYFYTGEKRLISLGPGEDDERDDETKLSYQIEADDERIIREFARY